MNDAQGCMNCGQLIEPYEISRNIGGPGGWYVRYYCPDDRRQWKSKLLEWTPTLRAAWYRDNVLSREGLSSAPSPMPWDVAQ